VSATGIILRFVLSGQRRSRKNAADLESHNISLAIIDKAGNKLNFLEAIDAGNNSIASHRFRSRQKRISKNIKQELATLKEIQQAVSTEVAIKKQMIEGYTMAGDYEKLPPSARKEAELTDKKVETEMMKQELEQEKIKQDLEALRNQKAVVEQKQKQTISPIEKITQELSDRTELITALKKAKQEALAKAKSEEEKISIERMYEDKILEVQDE